MSRIDVDTLTDDQVGQVHAARTAGDAAALLGGLYRPGYYGQLAYIKTVLGPRAIGGRFDTTRANVWAKFARVWRAQTGRES